MAKKKPMKPTKVEHVELIAETASKITAKDCAAFSVLIYERGEASEEWQQAGTEALGKFANFGWIAFHALGGLNLDWSAVTLTVRRSPDTIK
jgi:hypothetical protein